jgi:hypothetical protein
MSWFFLPASYQGEHGDARVGWGRLSKGSNSTGGTAGDLDVPEEQRGIRDWNEKDEEEDVYGEGEGGGGESQPVRGKCTLSAEEIVLSWGTILL